MNNGFLGVAAPPSNLNTILRSGDYVINDVTASKNDFALVVSAAMNLYKSLDPIRNKDVFSKLTKMLLPLLVNSVLTYLGTRHNKYFTQ